MITFFRENKIISYPVLFLLTIALHIVVFFQNDLISTAEQINAGPLTILVYNIFDYLFNNHLLARQIFVIILVFLQAILINKIINRQTFFSYTNQLPALMYILCVSILPEYLILHPMVLANTFLVLALSKVFSIYNAKKAYTFIFDTGFLIGIASLFYFPAVILLLFLFIIVAIYRALNWREWIIGMISFLIPYFLISTYYFWNNQLYEFYRNYIVLDFIDRKELFFNKGEITLLIYLSILMLLTFFKVWHSYLRSVIKIRNYLSIILWLLIIGSFSCLLQGVIKSIHFFILSIPISVFIGYYLAEIKKDWQAEVLFVIFLSMIFFGQYNSFFI